MTISWVNETVSPEDMIYAYQEDMQENIIYKNSNLVFDTLFQNKFQFYTVTSVRYTLSLLGVEHQGVISAFTYGDRSFAILK